MSKTTKRTNSYRQWWKTTIPKYSTGQRNNHHTYKKCYKTN